MDEVWMLPGLVVTVLGFWRFIFLMEHSARYTIDQGTIQVAIAGTLIGGGGLLAIAPVL